MNKHTFYDWNKPCLMCKKKRCFGDKISGYMICYKCIEKGNKKRRQQDLKNFRKYVKDSIKRRDMIYDDNKV